MTAGFELEIKASSQVGHCPLSSAHQVQCQHQHVRFSNVRVAVEDTCGDNKREPGCQGGLR